MHVFDRQTDRQVLTARLRSNRVRCTLKTDEESKSENSHRVHQTSPVGVPNMQLQVWNWNYNSVKIAVVPMSMWTSRTLRSRAILRPWQFLQRSRGLMRSPCPWHSWHIDCTCWMKPGSSCWMCTWVPVPLHPRHNSTAPSLPPRPISIHNLYISSIITRTYNTTWSNQLILIHIISTKHTSLITAHSTYRSTICL